MQEPASRELRAYLCTLALSNLLCISSCSTSVSNGNYDLHILTQAQENTLYHDLRLRHPDHENLAFPYRGIIECFRQGKPAYAVWMTESSPVGEGIIGIYDRQLNVLDFKITGPIMSIKKVTLRDGFEVLLVNEVRVTGTGIYEETLNVYDIDSLKEVLWSGIAEGSYVGVAGGVGAYLIHSAVVLLNIGENEEKALLVISTNYEGPDIENKVYDSPEVKLQVLIPDNKAHILHTNTEEKVEILYPRQSNNGNL